MKKKKMQINLLHIAVNYLEESMQEIIIQFCENIIETEPLCFSQYCFLNNYLAAISYLIRYKKTSILLYINSF